MCIEVECPWEGWLVPIDAWQSLPRVSEVEFLRAQQAGASAVILGALLDAWDGLPNDVKTDPAMDNMSAEMSRLQQAIEGDAPRVSDEAREMVSVDAGPLLSAHKEIKRLEAEVAMLWELLSNEDLESMGEQCPHDEECYLCPVQGHGENCETLMRRLRARADKAEALVKELEAMGEQSSPAELPAEVWVECQPHVKPEMVRVYASSSAAPAVSSGFLSTVHGIPPKQEQDKPPCVESGGCVDCRSPEGYTCCERAGCPQPRISDAVLKAPGWVPKQEQNTDRLLRLLHQAQLALDGWGAEEDGIPDMLVGNPGQQVNPYELYQQITPLVCRQHHVQLCHACADTDCNDNMTPQEHPLTTLPERNTCIPPEYAEAVNEHWQDLTGPFSDHPMDSEVREFIRYAAQDQDDPDCAECIEYLEQRIPRITPEIAKQLAEESRKTREAFHPRIKAMWDIKGDK
jgi:hypothetical protein